ncbi:MAG: CoA transferase, partial [Candidatus Binatia bacterium]
VDRSRHSLELIALFDEIFATKTRDEWAAIFDANDFIWAPVVAIKDVVDDPQARALGAFEAIEHRSGQTIELVRSPIEFSETPPSIRRGAPELGEHTEEILLELGYSWEDIGALRERKVLG